MSDSSAAVQHEYFKNVLAHFSCQSFINHNHTCNYNYYPHPPPLPPAESHNQNQPAAPTSQGSTVPPNPTQTSEPLPTEPMAKTEPDFYVDVRPEIPFASSPNHVNVQDEQSAVPRVSNDNSVKALVMNNSDQSMYVLLPPEGSDDRRKSIQNIGISRSRSPHIITPEAAQKDISKITKAFGKQFSSFENNLQTIE